ncbi:MAG: CotH kinase family protein, partial [Oscillospiraceae bacterium]|nr:CotH kinase family protein [Oscillospiraceae bacterium]
LRDAYSATYAANALSARPEEVFISRSPVRFSNNADLENLYAFLKQGGADEEKYGRIAAAFDLESLADWMVLQAYFTNYDLPGNIRYIRTADDQPWQMAFFDLDFGLRVADVTWDHVLDPVNEFGNLTRTVAAWPEFQDLLFRRMAALFAAGLNESSCLAALDEYCAAIAGELAREYQRWGEGAGELETTRAELRGMIQSNRQRECVDSLCRALGLDSAQIRAEYFGGMELE